MKHKNLISAYQGEAAIDNVKAPKEFKLLKKHEIRNLESFCNIMKQNGCVINDFDGFYIGYTIKQINKEFDLLRFGDSYILNIELKSELKVANKMQKLLNQMRKNYYYLKLLGCVIHIFEYVENDGFYQYIIDTDSIEKIEPSFISKLIKTQKVDFLRDPDKMFLPSNYLISPFNSTDKFIKNEYFLTTQQERVKNEIFDSLEINPMLFFTLSANAGTGKTLLMYDIAKDFINKGKKILIIHCGKLNHGHYQLISDYKWEIIPIKSVSSITSTVMNNIKDYSMIFIDESQRINSSQINALTQAAVKLNIPLLFSYDVKQYLKSGETLDVSNYLHENYPKIVCETKKLTNKIRTNKELASFITNLIDIGKSKDHLDYSSVSIDYFDNDDDIANYVDYLKSQGWIFITFTTSLKDPDPYNELEKFTETNAHDVIGQEFSKVAFVMDTNFKYGEKGNLLARNSYYSATGMLYQIVTRVVDELKILVLRNPELFYNLLRIKRLGDINTQEN